MKTCTSLLLSLLVAALVGNAPPVLANSPPTLNPILNVVLGEDAGNQTVALSGIGPGAGENQALSITGVSSNPGLIPNPTITYTSPNSSGSLTFRPASNASGTAAITVLVNDGDSFSNIVARTFLVIVAAVNDLPLLSPIENQVINENTSAGPIAFTVVDLETPGLELIVSANSSNPALVPTANIVISGSGTNRTVSVTPTPNQFGTAVITLTASDSGAATGSKSFLVTVAAVQRIARAENDVMVSWTATNGVLQHCDEVRGLWEDVVPEPTSPHRISPTGIKFYRLRQR